MSGLIDRYMTEVLHRLPNSQRQDVGAEIRGAIEEMVERRLDSGESRDLAERWALEELGDPVTLAMSYQDRPRYLIGPGWYPSYLKTLKIVPGIALPIVAVVSLLADVADGEPLLNALTGAVVAVAWAAAWILFWVTAGFVIAERSQGPTGPKVSWSPDDLPETSGPQQIGLWPTIGSIAVLVVFGAVVFIQDRDGIGTLVRGVSENLQDTAFLNPEIPVGWSWVFYGLIVFSIVAAVLRYRGRVWSRDALLLVASEAVLWSVFIVTLAMREPIFNPELGERIDAGADWWLVGNEANSIIAIVVILPTLLELWDGWQGYRENRRLKAVAIT